MVDSQLFRDLASTLSGEDGVYPAYGEDGRRAIEATLAAYTADAREAWVDLPLPPDDPVYAQGVAALL